MKNQPLALSLAFAVLSLSAAPLNAMVAVGPVISGVSPATVGTAGNDEVTITGTDFDPAMNISFTDGTRVGQPRDGTVVFVDATTVRFRVPDFPAGAVDITVEHNGIDSTLAGQLAFALSPPPAIEGVDIDAVSGFPAVKIRGQNLGLTSSVYFGDDVSGPVAVGGDGSLATSVPATAQGRRVFVKVTRVDGLSSNLVPFPNQSDLPGATADTTVAYPNPAGPGDNQVVFEVPANCKVRVYTMNGSLIREIDSTTTTAAWDLTDKDGNKVKTGIYLYVVTDAAGNVHKNRVAVVR